VRKPRADGIQARERILAAALRLFVDRGYARTSVRDIAHAADANIASIGYYFGDKAGLYRSALYEPLCGQPEGADDFDAPALDLADALARYMRTRLRPLALGEASQLSVRLRLREDVEPTGMLDDERSARQRTHARLVALLARHLDAAHDAELDALAMSIFALVAFPHYGREHIRRCAPVLLDAPDAVDAWIARLANYAAALVAAEHERRRAAARRAGSTTIRQQ
jgi:AcrR family transcriptional regulator